MVGARAEAAHPEPNRPVVVAPGEMTRQEFWTKFKVAAEGLSCRKVARLLGASPSSTSRWLKGTGAPPAPSRAFMIEEITRRRSEPALKKSSQPPSSSKAPPTLRLPVPR